MATVDPATGTSSQQDTATAPPERGPGAPGGTGGTGGTGGMAAWQMPLIHRIFRHGLREVGRLVPEVPPTATGRSRVVDAHLRFLLDGLHHHHTGEDEMVWPVLSERLGAEAHAVARMEPQHQRIDEEVTRVRGDSSRWAERPVPELADALSAALGRLLEVLEEHLDEEERVVVPLIDEHLSATEWEDMGRRIFERFTPRERPLAMGQLLEVARDDEARRMFADLPAPVRVLWAVAGKRQYRRYVGAVRGKPLNPLLLRALRAANPLAVRIYRRSGGRLGARAKGLPVLLLTVRGRRTGAEHTTPVAFLDLGDGYLVCGTGGGMAPEPQWFRNLRRADRARIQVGTATASVTVRVLDRAERDRVWDEVVLPRAPFFAKYEERSGRLVPIAQLRPADLP